jgi:ABC-type multidrug transport system permease subunit
MLRAPLLVVENEFRLLLRDRTGLFMLVVAPIVIIAVAGFSLGNVYGTRPDPHAYLIPVVDQDHGKVAASIIEALRREPSIAIMKVGDVDRARAIVANRDRAPLAIVIPPRTTDAIRAGRAAELVLYVDPIKRIEVSAIELRIGELCRRVTAGAQEQAARELAAQQPRIRSQVERAVGELKAGRQSLEKLRAELERRRAAAINRIDAQMRETISRLEMQTRATVAQSVASTRSAVEADLAARRDALDEIDRYLRELASSKHRFDQWLTDLKAAAGSRASAIPPPPAWPEPPTPQQLSLLSKPIEVPTPQLTFPRAEMTPQIEIRLPELPPASPGTALSADISALNAPSAPTLPGTLGWSERALAGGTAQVNTFDQYVPGFGITFLLIGMLMGISMGLIDERDWGTLARLRVSGAPLQSVLLGKLASRFMVGLLQMLLLLTAGWVLFGISLGRAPLMLLLPSVAISFAAAAFGLVIACIARTHDSVMPVGAVVAMAMSAIGGCWWPLDFEPSWMRAIALWVPTTWTMRAFNDLMIRDLPATGALRASAAAAGLGAVYLIVGLAGAAKYYD